MKYRILVKRLNQVFRHGSDLDARVARLAVLFEDLRLETMAASQESIPNLDESGVELRRFYFVRRSIATLREFSEALASLDTHPDFEPTRARFDPVSQIQWSKSIAFFRRWHRYLRDIRNDFGGHFGHAAARFAIDNLHDGGAVFEYAANPLKNTGTVRFKFAWQIVAASMRRHSRADGLADHFRLMFRLVLAAYGHAARCSQILARYDLWLRFSPAR